jgi:hypothetical protein
MKYGINVDAKVSLLDAKKHWRSCTRKILTDDCRDAMKRKNWYILDGVPHVMSVPPEYIFSFRRNEYGYIYCRQGFDNPAAEKEYRAK